MKKLFRLVLPGLLACLGASTLAGAQPAEGANSDSPNQTRVYHIAIKDMVSPASDRLLQKGLEAAREQQADAILLELNTYGGLVESADSMRQRLLNYPEPVWAFVNPNAASAGALLALACDSIYMTREASMGAATVVMGKSGEAAPDKYQSYMRATMRATAEANGRDPKIAQKMVDQNLELEGISPKGEVITFTASEALKHNYAEGQVQSVPELLKAVGWPQAQVIRHEPQLLERVIQFLLQPTVSSLLMLLIMGGVFMEFKTPGLGIPGAVAALSATLYFAPLYLEGLAAIWEILLFALGIVLLAAEIFVIPGFGVAGVAGILATLGSLAVALLRNDGLDFSLVPFSAALNSLALAVLMSLLSLVLVFWLGRNLIQSRRTYSLIDKETLQGSAYDSRMESLVGLEGVTPTGLRPTGFIMVDGQRIEVQTAGQFVDPGQRMRIVRIVGNTPEVAPVEEVQEPRQDTEPTAQSDEA